MYIHIVQPGDTIWSVANLYGISIEQLIKDNGLENLPNLILGQSLVIIADQVLYSVQPGDTLFSIGRKFGISPAAIASFNNLNSSDLIYPGMILVIPPINIRRRSIEVNGYIVPNTPEADTNVVNEVGPYLTYITPSSYVVNRDGSLKPLNDDAIVTTSKNYGVAPLLSISNEGEANFDPALAHAIFISQELQNILFNNVLNIMRTKGYYGLNINFERLFPEDRQLYNDFLRNAVNFFHQYNYPVSSALVPKTYDITTGEWWGGHDYKAQGEILDFVIIMTYDWGCVACPPMAVAPVNEIRKVLDYAVTVIPREKILMGVPFYGFDWTLPFVSGDRANLVDYREALQLAARYGATIQYDTLSQAPFFNYVDTSGRQHVVWYDDARSFQAKYNLVNEYNLRGVSYWALGLSAPQNWPVLSSMFDIIKLI